MIRYVLRRVLWAIPLLFGLVTLVFFITRLLPGDPTLLFISPETPPQIAGHLRTEFGLDQPVMVQYGRWLAGFVQGNLGFSFTHQRAVTEVIGGAFLNTALLAGAAIVIEVMLGILLGVLTVVYRDSIIEKIISYGGLITYTMPVFWVATLLLFLFSGLLGLLPSSHMHSVEADRWNSMDYSFDVLAHLILPSLTLAIPGAAGIARFVQAQLSAAMKEQYIVTARSFGLRERTILLKHALPNALLPVITLVGLELGGLLSGALVTETIFSWPGIGRIAVTAIFARDYPLIVGCTIVSGIAVIVGNLLADVLYTAADPRMTVRT